MTAKEWRDANPDKKGNIRDNAIIEQLTMLSNMESINALLIQQGVPPCPTSIAMMKLRNNVLAFHP
ncbi:hypothetical protein GCM10022218_13250 [Sphingobacterium ginsenosidimutans]|uniref:Uncharacterized protein n=1 Tax=Sphingobacterium ginsenosidimutans TaxID=687845 RepID=A0ABP7ZWG9_9SPHI